MERSSQSIPEKIYERGRRFHTPVVILLICISIANLWLTDVPWWVFVPFLVYFSVMLLSNMASQRRQFDV